MDDLFISARAVLAATPARWQQLAAGVPTALLARPAAPGQWSALNCLQHITDVERSVFPPRVRAILAGRNFDAFDPDSQGSLARGERSAAELAAEFATLRAESLRLFDSLTPADLPRQAVHAELGLMQPFIDGCGPWLGYFTDHVAHAHG
jgi:hypothetical protein